MCEPQQHIGSTGGIAPLSYKVYVHANQDDVLQMMFLRGCCICLEGGVGGWGGILTSVVACKPSWFTNMLMPC